MPGVRKHLIDRMRDRAIGIADLNQLRLWIESNPEVPEGDWCKDSAHRESLSTHRFDFEIQYAPFDRTRQSVPSSDKMAPSYTVSLCI
jgi:hypothetical protein